MMDRSLCDIAALCLSQCTSKISEEYSQYMKVKTSKYIDITIWKDYNWERVSYEKGRGRQRGITGPITLVSRSLGEGDRKTAQITIIPHTWRVL